MTGMGWKMISYQLSYGCHTADAQACVRLLADGQRAPSEGHEDAMPMGLGPWGRGLRDRLSLDSSNLNQGGGTSQKRKHLCAWVLRK